LKPFSLVLVTVICLSGLVAVGQSKKPKPKSKANAANKSSSTKIAANAQPNGSVETVNPGAFLLRDPLVQGELQLSAPQKAVAAELAAEFNELIWRFRDLSVDSEIAQREARLVNAQIKPRLEGLLNAGPEVRLDGIILQVQGTDAFALSATAAKRSLTCNYFWSAAGSEGMPLAGRVARDSTSFANSCSSSAFRSEIAQYVMPASAQCKIW
jgi:hypothetical protein